jgi:DNA-binding transcriptional MerR regulator
VEKGPDAFRTISEVADDLDLPQHVLRFWETRFAQIKPMKRGGGRRYYRPDDVDLLRGIRHLLYGEGYTIRGVQQILKDQGLRYVQTVGRSAETDPARLRDINFDQDALEQDAQNMSVSAGARGVVNFVAPSRPRVEPEMPRETRHELPRTLEPRIVEVQRSQPPAQAPVQPQSYDDEGPAIPFRKFAPAPDREEPRIQMRSPQEERFEPRAVPDERAYEPRGVEPRAVEPQMRAPAPSAPRAPMMEAPGSLRLPAEAVRLLKATLYELGECRRMLDASRKGGA